MCLFYHLRNVVSGGYPPLPKRFIVQTTSTIPFVFMQFLTLCQKYPDVGGRAILISHQSPLRGAAAAFACLFSAFSDPFPFPFRSEAANAWPFSAFCTASRSASTIILINSSKPTSGFHPSFSRAL